MGLYAKGPSFQNKKTLNKKNKKNKNKTKSVDKVISKYSAEILRKYQKCHFLKLCHFF